VFGDGKVLPERRRTIFVPLVRVEKHDIVIGDDIDQIVDIKIELVTFDGLQPFLDPHEIFHGELVNILFVNHHIEKLTVRILVLFLDPFVFPLVDFLRHALKVQIGAAHRTGLGSRSVPFLHA
jgi:hypothetical protein